MLTITIRRERTGHWTTMRRSPARFSKSDASRRTPWSADCIINTSESEFSVHTGAGIGGEYTAINSTIQELVPARYRGWTDLVINGSFWVGAAIGAGASIVLLDPALFSPDIGWRVAFFMGSVLGLVIFIMRFWIPESPRWLVIHGRPAEAQLIIAGIEERFRRRGVRLGEESLPRIRLATRRFTPLREVARKLLVEHRRRTAVGLA